MKTLITTVVFVAIIAITTQAQNVGIGTTTPITKLHVFDTASSNRQAALTTRKVFQINRGGLSNNKWAMSAGFYLGSYDSIINAASSLEILLGNNNSQNPDTKVMTLQANGNVGIGLNKPRGIFDVNKYGDIYLAENTNDFSSDQKIFLPANLFFNSSNFEHVTNFNVRNGFQILHDQGILPLSSRMYIDGQGRVGFGTSSPRGSFDVNLQDDIYMYNTDNNNKIYLPSQTILAANGLNAYLNSRNANTNDNTNLYINEAMVVSKTGTVGIGNTHNHRGVFDINRDGDVFLVNNTQGGNAYKAYMPGEVNIVPSTENYALIQARRLNTGTSNVGLQIRTTNAGTLFNAMHIRYDGRVGIGTNQPRGALDVSTNGDIYLTQDPNVGTTNSIYMPGHVFLAPYDNSNVAYLQARRESANGDVALQIRTGVGSTYYDAMHITPDGKVGLSTPTPRGVFDVAKAGNIYLAQNTTVGSTQQIYLPGIINITPVASGGFSSHIAFINAVREDESGDMGLEIRTTADGNLRDAISISKLGDVTIKGDQRTGINNTTYNFDVLGDSRLGSTYVNGNLSVGTVPDANAKLKVSGGVNYGLRIDAAGADIAALYVNGDAKRANNSATWTVTSDARLKQNIQKYTHGLAEILRINPVTYQYNQLSGFNTQATHVGILAQELQKIAPYMVNDSKQYLTVDSGAFNYMLINAIKELSAEITELKAKLEKLSKN